MKKVTTILGVIIVALAILTSCGGQNKGSNDSKWESLAEKSGLAKEDVSKAIEIGTKMSDCYQLESAPGKYDSEMTEECDPFMKEYTDYCVTKFGTDEWSGDLPENKKNDAFRRIMFDTRNDLAKLKSNSKKNNNSSSSEAETSSSEAETSSSEAETSSSDASGDCEQFCSDYEAFADEYVALMKKYKANPSDLSIVAEYTEMLSKASEMEKSSEDCTADAKAAARISKALAKIAKAAY